MQHSSSGIMQFWLGLGLISTSAFIFAGCCTCVHLDACEPLLKCPFQEGRTSSITVCYVFEVTLVIFKLIDLQFEE
jgi:hypothetical protein